MIKPVTDYPNYYVSDDGKVYSTKRGHMKELKSWKHRPELWERLREMDREIQTSYQPELRFNRASFTDTDKRLQVEDEFEAQGKPTRNKAFFDELKRRGIRYI